MSAMSRPVRWVSLALACVLALPIPLGMGAGLHLRLSPLLALQALLARAPLAPLSALAGAVLLLVFLRERWFCRNVCPTGALCDAVAACRRTPQSWDAFPFVNKALALAALAAAACGAPVLAVADPVALFHGAWGIAVAGLTAAALAGAGGLATVLLLSLLFPRLWCARLCPLGGLQLLAADLRRAARRAPPGPETAPPLPSPMSPVLGRRHLFAAASGVAVGLVAREAAGAGARTVVRPPGARPEARFKTVCCRCGSCARACPERIIRPTADLRDPLGLLAPRLDFTSAFCPPTCAACGAACPTGALAPFDAADKGRLVVGTAVIWLDDCRLTEGKECNRCEVACAYRAVRIAGGRFEPAPEVIVSACVGCGACVVACPTRAIDVRPA
jgi:formate hydrogenlyase subunit 6/NADH:ubiquinone oxidoreductase subunit I